MNAQRDGGAAVEGQQHAGLIGEVVVKQVL